jgi:hypothetical protein
LKVAQTVWVLFAAVEGPTVMWFAVQKCTPSW